MKSFAPILNSVEIRADLPIEIIPRHFLQKADPEQVQLIREQLCRMDSDGGWRIAFETAHVDKGAGATSRTPLPTENWRYWVIAFEGSSEMHDLELAAALLRNELDFGLTWIVPLKGWGKFLGRVYGFQHLGNVIRMPPVEMGNAEVEELGVNYRLVKRVQETFPPIYQSLRRFHDLKALQNDSTFLVIGYISVIESLITHAPELTEPMDSLTHQIKTKMNLLSKRVQRSLDYQSLFGITDGDKVWRTLYEYRSKLAHGDVPDFKCKLKLLGSPENALRFLKEAAKLVILYAMNEPEFVIDLKRC